MLAAVTVVHVRTWVGVIEDEVPSMCALESRQLENGLPALHRRHTSAHCQLLHLQEQVAQQV